MPGLPGDTPKTIVATFRRTLLLRPDFLRIYPTLVIAGTELEKMYRRGEYTPLSLSDAVTLCKVLFQEALKASIPVVRIGLQASEELQEGAAIVAGPWHSAFRQLVEGELFFDLMAILTAGLSGRRPVTFYCSPARVSEVIGQRRANLLRLRQERGIEVAVIKIDPGLSRQQLRMETEHITRSGTMLNLNYTREDITHDC
jgi:hypothetical protein